MAGAPKTIRLTPPGMKPKPTDPVLPLRGLGDVVARATKAVGIKPCAGCKKRQEKLNRWVPFSQR
jgi:hypothetical protein